MPKVTAVIPAYNEASRIINTLKKVSPYVNEMLVIDDASTDNTAQLAEQFGARVLRQKQNQGYISAIKKGFQHANGDIVVTIDADGEFSADAIPALITPIMEGKSDMVQGCRDIIPRPSERLLSRLASVKTHVGDSGTGLRAIRTELAQSLTINGACICGVLCLEIAAKGGRIAEVPISLQQTDKPRSIAWFHIAQFFYLLPWLFRKLPKQG